MNLEDCRRLPLHERHEAAGARFAPFAGYQMPMRFSTILAEHEAVRHRVGVFDVSHMGEVYVRGSSAREAVNRLVTNDVSTLFDGRAMYTVMCRPDGGIIDDLIVYQLSENELLLCVNAANRKKDFEWIAGHLEGDAVATDESDDIVQLAVQGPEAIALVDSLTDIAAADVEYYHARPGKVAGHDALVSRTGYTGEDGVELYIRGDAAAVAIYDAIFEQGDAVGIASAGLAPATCSGSKHGSRSTGTTSTTTRILSKRDSGGW